MASAGQRFDMPDGSAFIVRRPAADSDGAFVEMEFAVPSGCVAPPPHIHPRQVESYEVIEGTFEVMVAGEWTTLAEGDSASVPQAVDHTYRNRSGETARVLNWHRPAVGFEDFIERVGTLLSDAGVRRKRDPRIAICLATAFLEFDETLIPSRRRDRIAMDVMSRAGRLLGVTSGTR
jgi:quercetin dioxygenase-like cupin family protein